MKKYIAIILSLFFSIVANADDILKDTTNIRILDYPDSFNSLIHQFRGKVIYIDLMASWCSPCISELKESKNLESFFGENDIIKIYITIDQRQDIDKCISLLNGHEAKGYFIPYLPPSKDMTTSFPSDIENLFLKNEKGEMEISIPKYAIIDKEGNIVIKRAERPSNKEALKNQLKEWLNKD